MLIRNISLIFRSDKASMWRFTRDWDGIKTARKVYEEKSIWPIEFATCSMLFSYSLCENGTRKELSQEWRASKIMYMPLQLVLNLFRWITIDTLSTIEESIVFPLWILQSWFYWYRSDVSDFEGLFCMDLTNHAVQMVKNLQNDSVKCRNEWNMLLQWCPTESRLKLSWYWTLHLIS